MQKKTQYTCPVDTWCFVGHAFKTPPLVGCVPNASLKKFASFGVNCARLVRRKTISKRCAISGLVVIKGDTFAKSHIMETYTSQADDLYQEANEIEYPDYIPPYTSCNESLLKFEEIYL